MTRAPGDHLPPEQDHYRYVTSSGVLGYSGKSVVIVVRSHDSGDADRAGVLYIRSVLGGVAPFRVKHHGEHEEAIRLRPIKNPYRQVVTRRRVKGIQAKHISDMEILQAYRRALEKWPSAAGWVGTGQICEELESIYPYYVVWAKCNILHKRRGYFVYGCHRDYRGDWELTDKGREELDR